METPDFMSYKDKFSVREFSRKISSIAKRAGAKLVYAALLLYYTLQSKDISLKNKALIIGALGYLISPLDVIPDAIPIAGLGDDLGVLLFVLQKVQSSITDEIKQKARNKLGKWFDEDEIKDLGTPGKPLTLYAVWEANTYKITLTNSNATTAGTTSVTATYDSNALKPSYITLPQRKYTVSGFDANSTGATISSIRTVTSTYTFNGWYTAASGGSKVLTNTASPAFVASVSGYTDANQKYIKAGTTTLYAQWTSKSVTLPKVQKKGYICKWNTKNDGTGTSYNSEICKIISQYIAMHKNDREINLQDFINYAKANLYKKEFAIAFNNATNAKNHYFDATEKIDGLVEKEEKLTEIINNFPAMKEKVDDFVGKIRQIDDDKLIETH